MTKRPTHVATKRSKVKINIDDIPPHIFQWAVAEGLLEHRVIICTTRGKILWKYEGTALDVSNLTERLKLGTFSKGTTLGRQYREPKGRWHA